MGRATLILVVLLSTLFAGIAMRMNKHMLMLPDVLRDDQIKRETENISDYALRSAISYATESNSSRLKNWIGNEYDFVEVVYDTTTPTSVVTTADGDKVYTIGTGATFPIANGFINRTVYSNLGGTFTGANKEIRFRAATQVQGTMQGKTVYYPAEIAFNYFKVDNPNCFYFEMNQAQLEGQADMNDTSGNGNNAFPNNGLHTFPTPGDGVAGWKCGFWHDDRNDTAYAPDHISMRVDSTFTLVTFAKLDKDLTILPNAALVWLPSAEPSPGSVAPPASAIWYNATDQNIHFTVGLLDGTSLEVKYPYKALGKLIADSSGQSGQGYRNFPWDFFALTYNWGVLTAYYNGIPLETTYGNPTSVSPAQRAAVSKFGVSVGCRITKINGNAGNNFNGSQFDMGFNGVLDQVGMFSRALTPQEVWDFFTFTQMPTKVDYIRD